MRILSLCILLALSISAYGISFESINVSGGIIWVGNGDRSDETTGAPSPIDQEIGVRVPLRMASHFIVEPGILYYGMDFGFDGGPRPRPVQIEHREMFVLNWIAELNFLFPIELKPSITLSPGLSAAAVFRVPAITAPGEPDRSAEMAKYFYEWGRFFLPGGFVKLNWQFSNKYSFTLRPGVRLPVYRLWYIESAPVYDQMIIYCDLGFSYKF